MALYAACDPLSMAEQIQGCSTLELRKKGVEFATLLHLLAGGWPMTEFESQFELYEFLNVFELPRKHWADGSS